MTRIACADNPHGKNDEQVNQLPNLHRRNTDADAGGVNAMEPSPQQANNRFSH